MGGSHIEYEGNDMVEVEICWQYYFGNYYQNSEIVACSNFFSLHPVMLKYRPYVILQHPEGLWSDPTTKLRVSEHLSIRSFIER